MAWQRHLHTFFVLIPFCILLLLQGGVYFSLAIALAIGYLISWFLGLHWNRYLLIFDEEKQDYYRVKTITLFFGYPCSIVGYY